MATEITDPVELLERHMVETFVTGYIERAMGKRTAVKIEPNAIFMAMRFAGLKASRQTLERVLAEMVSK
jgi:hypothetical protein